jgi:mannose/fructose/sorbose-specific phosphotransferase system IIA component
MTKLIIPIIVAAHGDLAQALYGSAELIAGAQEGVICLGLPPGGNLQAFSAQLAAALASSPSALVLVDMQGGTPWNVAVRLAAPRSGVRVVSGVSLPMLLEVLLARAGQDVDALAQLAVDTGVRAVQINPTQAA